MLRRKRADNASSIELYGLLYLFLPYSTVLYILWATKVHNWGVLVNDGCGRILHYLQDRTGWDWARQGRIIRDRTRRIINHKSSPLVSYSYRAPVLP